MNRTDVVRAAIGAAGILLTPPLFLLQELRDQAPILLYHRVAPVADQAYAPLQPAVFDQHCDFLARRFRVVPLLELIERATSRRSTRGCCAITFDDGYLDFREHALPILRRRGLPVTHFLVADCVEQGRPPWTYRLNRLALAKGWSAQHTKTSQRFLGTMDAPARTVWLEGEERAAPTDPPLPAMLRPKDVRAIDDPLVTWGSHSASHGFLNRVSDREVEREVVESKRRLEAVTGTAIRLLAYPNGHHDDRVHRAAEKAGYAAALTVNEAPIGPSTPRFGVPRFDVGGHPTRMMKVEVTGLLGALRRLRSA